MRGGTAGDATPQSLEAMAAADGQGPAVNGTPPRAGAHVADALIAVADAVARSSPPSEAGAAAVNAIAAVADAVSPANGEGCPLGVQNGSEREQLCS